MSSWKQVRFSEICDITRGGSPRPIQEYMTNDGVPWIKISDATASNSRFIEKTKEFIKTSGISKSREVFPDDLILSNSATPGIPKFMRIYACIHDGWLLLRNFNGAEKEFIYWLLLNERDKLIQQGNGSVFTNLKTDILKNHIVNIPDDIEEQKRIATILNNIQEKIELNTQINQTLEQIAQTIFKSWFIDFDPVHAKANALASGQTLEQATQAAMAVISGKNTQELHRLQTANPEQYQQLWEIAEAFPSGFDEEGVPWGWESKKVGEVAKIVKGKKPKLISSEPDDGFLPHILMASLSGKYTEYAQIDKSIVCDIFDTLILMDGAASGKIAIGHKGVIGSTFAKMELSENKYWALFNLFMFSKEQDIQANTTGTSIPHTDKARVLDYEIIVPCDVVLNYFTEMYKNILCSILNQRKNSFILENIRDLLLPKLLSGEILNGN
ncbi:restriction endonuclease subunit S [Glaesserella parasuis]|uniref:restriction endonuclease subunit S n=1 Tax=Glaesserella parasuis TaxID=738 RepID=UPI0024368452|nr:restriction endonuclease subunit S [Glaesserella parasuis]MDG6273834.1 restriction endonuclease subunit S [Glaesserella parasuis]MDG6277777.1 restriction endonuclease subunit S [Glaesserella parasuis]MDG6298854.1 restriction endonuclease subunit S [Glaesserella parasuis]MDG6320485.1 restriction endonuclease subunit S [Glaesserella parasuis]